MRKLLLFLVAIITITCFVACDMNTYYTVKFDANGAEGDVPAPITVRRGKSFTAPSGDSLSIEGLTFCGWNSSKGGRWEAEYKVNQSVNVFGDLILYAHWKSDCIYFSTDNRETYAFVKGVLSKAENVSSVVIPHVYNGLPVTGIGYFAFLNCNKSLMKVTMPSSITHIAEAAFHYCSRLTTITIPEGVTSIGKAAFAGCSGLTGSLVIPEGVTRIESSTFSCCDGLTSITIPRSVTSIGEEAFTHCRGLMSVTIPEGVTRIESSAFSYCYGLTSITIPESMTSIGDSVFYECRSLSSIIYSGTCSQWNSIQKDFWWNDGTANYTIHCTDGDIAKN